MSPWQSICYPFYLTHAPGAFTGAAVKNRPEAFHNRIQDSWYRVISACLLDRIKEKSLAEKAGEQPAYLVTGHVALGLWAEGSDQKKQALRHYKKALGSYRDDRIEYQFAKERIKRLQAAIAN